MATCRRIYAFVLTLKSRPPASCLLHTTTPAGPSAFLSIGRIAAFVGGSIYAGQKMGALQAEANAADIKLLAEFDLAEARKPAAERHVLGTRSHYCPTAKPNMVCFGFHHGSNRDSKSLRSQQPRQRSE